MTRALLALLIVLTACSKTSTGGGGGNLAPSPDEGADRAGNVSHGRYVTRVYTGPISAMTAVTRDQPQVEVFHDEVVAGDPG